MPTAASAGLVSLAAQAVVRRAGTPVKLVEGSTYNFKVTTPGDLAIAELLVREGLV